ncbi:hypothetical protein ACTMTI_49670 [Nonomuraea sp. H19]|uniref:hypothetical protein n=1 Tax=Nonomuraea sp. H19 TaxID=3452206 RepID=UPI003F8CC95A
MPARTMADTILDVRINDSAASRAGQARDVPAPHVIGLDGHQLGFNLGRMRGLSAAFADQILLPQGPVHRRLRGQIDTLVEEFGPDLRHRLVREARLGQDRQHVLPLGRRQLVGRRSVRAGLAPWTNRPRAFPIQGGAGIAQQPARLAGGG